MARLFLIFFEVEAGVITYNVITILKQAISCMGLTHILCCLIGLDLLSLIFTAGYYFIVIQFSENMYLGIAIFTALLVELAAATEKSPIVQISDRESALVIENGYVKLTFDKTAASISELYADFSGASEFETNVLVRPFTLSTTFANSTLSSSCNSFSDAKKGAHHTILTQSEDVVELMVEGIVDCADFPIAEESWHITLHRAERFVQVYISGGTTVTAAGHEVVSIGHGVYTAASSLYGLFDRGVVQMMNNPGKCMGSDQSVDRLYALGNDQAIDVLYRAYPLSATPSSDSSSSSGHHHLSGPAEVVLYSQYSGATSRTNTPFGSGFQDVLLGSYPRKSLGE